MEAQILTWITFIPLIGMGAILLLPRQSLGAIKGVSLVATAIPLVLATWLYFGLFQKGTADLQFIQDVVWISAIDAHYKVGVDPCPPRHGNRKGVVEKAIHYLTQHWWRTARVASPAEAQTAVDHFCATTADARPRDGATVGELGDAEPLLGLPAAPFPVEVVEVRLVAANALGVIHQTLQTIVVAAHHRPPLTVAGVVLNDVQHDTRADASHDSNYGELVRRCGVPVLAHVPYCGGEESVRHVDWRSLLAEA